jgi:rhodanese-related sulfurtransferase
LISSGEPRHPGLRSVPVVVLFFLAAAVLIGLAWSAATRHSLEPLTAHPYGDPGVIALEQAREAYLAKSALFLDARSEQEYSEGHIPGALDLSIATREKKLPQLRRSIVPGARIIAYCNGGTCQTAEALASWLAERGWYNVSVMKAGTSEWKQAGYELRTGESP